MAEQAVFIATKRLVRFRFAGGGIGVDLVGAFHLDGSGWGELGV